jgi:serine/threonine kinase PknH
VLGLEGSRVGRYVLQDCLGHGSHTAVYRAWAPSDDWVALKLVDGRLQGGEDLAERLRRDAAALEQVGQPHILPILNALWADEMTAVAMPLLDAPSLRDLIRGGGLHADLAWSILCQVADSLQAAHGAGLTCRVLKPGNVLVGDDGRAYLAEFGVAGRFAGQVGLTAPDCRLSAAQYLAPEQVMGEEPDYRADVYAFAVLVFELATGTPLYEGAHPSAILRRTLNAPAPSACARNSGIPTDVDVVLRRALARDPRVRHGSVGELVEELVCPPQTNGARTASAADPGLDIERGGEVTVDAFIDVLSGVLAPEGGSGEVSQG